MARLENQSTVQLFPINAPYASRHSHGPEPIEPMAKHRSGDGCAMTALGMVASVVIILAGLAMIVLAVTGVFKP